MGFHPEGGQKLGRCAPGEFLVVALVAIAAEAAVAGRFRPTFAGADASQRRLEHLFQESDGTPVSWGCFLLRAELFRLRARLGPE